MSGTYFNRTTTTPDRQAEAVHRAYRAAGVTPPNAHRAAVAAIKDEPGADQVAFELAREAFTTDDADTFLEKALTRVQRAQAADALRAALARANTLATRQMMPTTIAQAAQDLGPVFVKLVKELTTAASRLDRDNPLSAEYAIRDDTSKQLKTAQAALAALGPFASMHVGSNAANVSAALAKVLPVVELPECQVEARVDSLSDKPRVVNAHELDSTYAVRDLTRALERDIDRALIAVARGDFPGVTLSLAATPSELRARIVQAQRAHKSRKATDEEARKGGRVRVHA